jgi:hypothetical protein
MAPTSQDLRPGFAHDPASFPLSCAARRHAIIEAMSSEAHQQLVELGASLMSDCDSAKAYLLSDQDRAYVLAAHDRLTRADLRDAMTVIYDHAGERGPARLLFWESPTSKGFDRDVLEFYKEERFKDAPQPDEVAVVTNSRVISMVVSATGIGFRLFTKRQLRVYDDITAAIAGQG